MERYFVCENYDGLFVSLDKISPDPFPMKPKESASIPVPRPAHSPKSKPGQFKPSSLPVPYKMDSKGFYLQPASLRPDVYIQTSSSQDNCKLLTSHTLHTNSTCT